MKTVYSVIFLPFLIILLLVTSVNGYDDWLIYDTSNEGDIYLYNKVSINHRTKDILQVWCKQVYSDKSREDYIQVMTKSGSFTKTELEKLSFVIILQEIDCKGKKHRILSMTGYDEGGKTLYSGSDDKEKWRYIIPDSRDDELRKKVCPK